MEDSDSESDNFESADENLSEEDEVKEMTVGDTYKLATTFEHQQTVSQANVDKSEVLPDLPKNVESYEAHSVKDSQIKYRKRRERARNSTAETSDQSLDNVEVKPSQNIPMLPNISVNLQTGLKSFQDTSASLKNYVISSVSAPVKSPIKLYRTENAGTEEISNEDSKQENNSDSSNVSKSGSGSFLDKLAKLSSEISELSSFSTKITDHQNSGERTDENEMQTVSKLVEHNLEIEKNISNPESDLEFSNIYQKPSIVNKPSAIVENDEVCLQNLDIHLENKLVFEDPKYFSNKSVENIEMRKPHLEQITVNPEIKCKVEKTAGFEKINPKVLLSEDKDGWDDLDVIEETEELRENVEVDNVGADDRLYKEDVSYDLREKNYEVVSEVNTDYAHELDLQMNSEDVHEIVSDVKNNEANDVLSEVKSNEVNDIMMDEKSNEVNNAMMEVKSNEVNDVMIEVKSNEVNDVMMEVKSNEVNDVMMEVKSDDSHEINLQVQSNEVNQKDLVGKSDEAHKGASEVNIENINIEKDNDGWDDFEVDLEIQEEDQNKELSVDAEEKQTGNTDGWDDFDENWDSWGDEEDAGVGSKTNQEPKTEGKLGANKEEWQGWDNFGSKTQKDSWGWSSWGVNSLISTASVVTQGLSNVLESGLGVPDPETLAAQQRQVHGDTRVAPIPDTAADNNTKPSFGIINLATLVPGVTHITKIVEQSKVHEIGSKVISGGLDTLENIGKKTMEVLQDGDPGLKKKKAILLGESNKPVLSQLLREAKDKADRENKLMEEKVLARKCQFEWLFDDFQGLVHLEALEMLSKQCEYKLEQAKNNLPLDEVEDFLDTLDEVSQLCDLDGEEEMKFVDFKSSLLEVVLPLQDILSVEKILKIDEDINEWLDKAKLNKTEITNVKIQEKCVSAIAELTAAATNQFHKVGELLLVKERRQTVQEADTLLQMTEILCQHIRNVTDNFVSLLSVVVNCDEKLVNSLGTEADNASSYVKQAFTLLIPVLQLGAI